MLLASATASATSITRDHSLVSVTSVDDPEITVLTTITDGVVPGAADNVTVSATVVAVGKLFNVAPLIPQYPL
jgi:Zn-dependent M28 family amino/carboxypeptidase